MKYPTPAQLQKAWEELKEMHREYLMVHEVKLPSAEYYSDKAQALWLAVLYYYKNQEVDKNTISEIAQRDIPGVAPDQQVRHLKRDGWTIGDKKGIHKLNPFKPSTEYQNMVARRQGRLKASNFEELKGVFGNRCATCGATEGRPDPRYGDEIVNLQQGHQNPYKPGNDPENIIPQCQFCNRSYQNNFIFDDKGRVAAIANVRPVRLAPENVQQKVFDWLSKKFIN